MHQPVGGKQQMPSQQAEFLDYDESLKKKDFFPKIFLIPSEVRLDKEKGLVVIKRTSEHPDKYQEQDVQDISIFPETCTTSKNPGGHGLLSLFKKTTNRKIKLAICVCVYSEPKNMLKSTIKGIQQSYKHFYQRAGVMPHEIILIVIFDGIEKVNNSHDQSENMVSFFNEIDLKNGFRYKPYGKSVDDYFKEFKDIENYDDISVFTEEELKELHGKLFETQYKEYTRIKKLLGDIRGIKGKKDVSVEELPVDVFKKYQELSMRYCLEHGINCVETREQVQDYMSTKRELRVKILFQALRETELLCVRYLQSRNDKAILYPVRMETEELEDNRKPSSSSKLQDEKKDFQYMFFCVKHKNGGKLSSHMLFFEGFCKTIDPQFCILLDVGLKPSSDAIYRMWSYLQRNKKCGGVCGYMGLKVENPADDLGYRNDGYDTSDLDILTKISDKFVNVQRAQQFEYHFAHMLDKPFEAFFSYVHVLPGAFSGYRWKALQSIRYDDRVVNKSSLDPYANLGTEDRKFRVETFDNEHLLKNMPEEHTLMKQYLKTATSEQIELTLHEANMYLAEDRVMCLGIHALGYDLAYLPDAESTVDPVTSLAKMLGQRRRWINGSWFAFQYVMNHSSERGTFGFYFQLSYYWLVQKITYISLAIFYISMKMTVSSAVEEYIVPAFQSFFQTTDQWQLSKFVFGILDMKTVCTSIPDIVNFVYIVALLGMLFLSLNLNQNNKKFSKWYYFMSSLLGFYGILMFILLVFNTVQIFKDVISWNIQGDFVIPVLYLKLMIIFVLGGHALPVIWTFSLTKWMQMIISLPSYIFYVPSYINTLLIYSFCRIDDLSWGTKGLDEDVERNKSEQWRMEKMWFVFRFLLVNVLVAFAVTQVLGLPGVRGYIILIVTCLVVFLLGFKLIYAAFYLLVYNLKRCASKFSADTISNNIKNGKQVLHGLRVIEDKIKQIEKAETRIKKEQQFRDFKNSRLFESFTSSNISSKTLSLITKHIIDNNIIPQRELSSGPRRPKSRKKVLLKKKLQVIEEASNESLDTCQMTNSSVHSEAADQNAFVPYRTVQVNSQSRNLKERIDLLKKYRNQ